ncbi:hypothetical protein RFI_08348, partial [Reticulomyxa filosa]
MEEERFELLATDGIESCCSLFDNETYSDLCFPEGFRSDSVCMDNAQPMYSSAFCDDVENLQMKALGCFEEQIGTVCNQERFVSESESTQTPLSLSLSLSLGTNTEPTNVERWTDMIWPTQMAKAYAAKSHELFSHHTIPTSPLSVCEN